MGGRRWTSNTVGAGKASATKCICGLGTGKKATGAPIKLGGIAMLIPGVDFTTIGKIAKAYFKCVNDNGGINGRPIKYTLYNEQLNPAQQGSLAKKLIESDKVVGVVGNTSFTECGINWKYYSRKGFTVIGAGVQAECFGTPNIVEVNMGPRYSNIGAAQALVRRGAKSLVDRVARHGRRVLGRRRGKVAKAAGHPVQELPDQAPDDGRELERPAARAGRRGRAAAILIDFTPDSAPAYMKAAIAQGVIDKVRGAPRRRSPTTFMAKQFPQFDGKIYINQEFGNSTDKAPGPCADRAIAEKYAPKIALQAFGQMGFMAGKFATQALLSAKGAVTAKSYNEAVRNLKNVEDGHALQAVVRRQAAVPHPEQHGHQGRPTRAARSSEGQVLRDPGGRQGARADARLGEAVQAQHGQVAERRDGR